MLLVFLAGCEQKEVPIKLPDLTNMTIVELETLLSNSSIDFEVVEENDFNKPDGIFVNYEAHAINDEIETDELVTVIVNIHRLPDLTGKSESEIIQLFDTIGIDIQTVFDEGNNDFDNLTWSGYEEYNVGDKISELNTDTVTIKIAINSTTVLPDLEGLNIYQIKKELNASFIQFKFEYFEDDLKEMDTFYEYLDYQAGDMIDDDIIVTVKLYSNSFVENEVGLFISKFWDNEGKNKAIEIYNPTDSTINLSDYSIAVLANGSLIPSYSIPLDGQIDSNGTFILTNPEGNREILLKSDQSSTQFVFDGNDVIQLRYKNGTYIDIISTIGSSVFSLTNELYVRQPEVTVGNRNFNFKSWDEYVPTYVSPFGTHPFSRPESFDMDLSYLGREFGHALGGMVKVTLVTTTDGDTAEFTPGFESNARIRFLGVDTPETHPIVQPLGLEAKAFTRSLLESATDIYLQSDPNTASVDTYGRHLGFVWTDGQLVNYLLVRNGFSDNMLTSETKLVYNNRYIYRWFQDAEQYAIENELGIHKP